MHFFQPVRILTGPLEVAGCVELEPPVVRNGIEVILEGEAPGTEEGRAVDLGVMRGDDVSGLVLDGADAQEEASVFLGIGLVVQNQRSAIT